MNTPVVTGSKPQVNPQPAGVTGGSLIEAKKKAKAKVAMQHRVQKRMLAGNKPTKPTSSKPPATGGSTTSTTPTAPVVEPPSRAQSEVDLEFSPAERKLIDAVGQGKAHQTTIDRVYAGYQQSHQGAQDAVKAATAGALAGMQHSAAEGLQAASGAQGQANAQTAAQAQTTGADTGQNGEVAKQVIQALASVQQGGQIQQNVQAQQGDAESAALSRLGLIAEGQKNQFHENTQAYVNQLGRDQIDLGKEKSAAVIKRQGELDDQEAAAVQQQITNTLAEKSLLQKTDAANKDYEIRLQDLRVKADEIQARRDIAGDANTSAELIAGNHDANDIDVAKLTGKLHRKEGETQRAFEARQNAANRKNARIIAARGGKGGVGGGNGGTYRSSTGQTVTLTADKEIAWQGRRSTYVGLKAAASGEIQRLGGKTDEKAFNQVIQKVRAKYKGAPPEVVRAAVYDVLHPGKLGGSYATALDTYFFGLVPAGLTSKSFVKIK